MLKDCLVVLVVLFGASAGNVKDDCPCAKPELCNPIRFTASKEVVGFVVNEVCSYIAN